MDKKLDLRNVKIYSNTKGDIIYALYLIGEEVYLSNDSNFNTYDVGNLVGIKYIDGNVFPFLGRPEGDKASYTYRFFVLAKDAKFKKGLRPFKSVSEFCLVTSFQIGRSLIRYRRKGDTQEFVMAFSGWTNGYTKNINEESVVFGGTFHSLNNLFENYEYYDNDSSEWKPFGIVE